MKVGDLVQVSECRALSGTAVILSVRGHNIFDILMVSGQKAMISGDFLVVINESR